MSIEVTRRREARVREMSWPAICRHCSHLHDAGKAQTVQRYLDCSVWRCPNCQALLDDRPASWGGSLTGEDAIRRAIGGFDRRTGTWWA